jgi:hypothetical protein
MRTGVCGCICMLYVILVNTCRVDQLIFTVQCELNKLQINFVKIFYFFCKKQQNRFVSRLTGGLERFFAGFSPVFAGKPIQIQIDLNWSNRSVFTGFYRFTIGKPLPMGGGFCIQNGFVNRGDEWSSEAFGRAAFCRSGRRGGAGSPGWRQAWAQQERSAARQVGCLVRCVTRES